MDRPSTATPASTEKVVPLAGDYLGWSVGQILAEPPPFVYAYQDLDEDLGKEDIDSGWTICEQIPGPGEPVPDGFLLLGVARGCD